VLLASDGLGFGALMSVSTTSRQYHAISQFWRQHFMHVLLIFVTLMKQSPKAASFGTIGWEKEYVSLQDLHPP